MKIPNNELYQINLSESVQPHVAVVGLGHVGITVAAVLADCGCYVSGIDVDKDAIRDLALGRSHVKEPGLEGLLQASIIKNQIEFSSALKASGATVFVIAVGSPVNDDGVADLSALKSVGQQLATLLKPQDLVLLRSTVPVGFTRKIFLPILESGSGLKAGTDFYLSFSPERTLEGKALQELRTLPQIVGGISGACVEAARVFWKILTATIVVADTIEAAEIVKLANNTYRDLSFAFANELSLLCDAFNIDAFKVIESANHGYPRNPIPRPSPGVGGYCLTKDPLLYGQPITEREIHPHLGKAGRRANVRALEYPIQILKEWSKHSSIPVNKMNVLVIGAAFKGNPATADLRESPSVATALMVKKLGSSLKTWDAVVPFQVLNENGLHATSDVARAIQEADVILILNNHSEHAQINFCDLLKNSRRPVLVFDGWRQLNPKEILQIPNVAYGTMGFASFRRPQA